MMRRAVRVATSTAVAVAANWSGCNAVRHFSSSYSDNGIADHRPSLKPTTRSNAHRHTSTIQPSSSSSSPAMRRASGGEGYTHVSAAEDEESSFADDLSRLAEDDVGPAPAKRNVKNHYAHLFKPQTQRIRFTNTFTAANAPATNAVAAANRGDEDDEDDEHDAVEQEVTRIYSNDELRRHLGRQGEVTQEGHSGHGEGNRLVDEDSDVLRALEDDEMGETNTTTATNATTTLLSAGSGQAGGDHAHVSDDGETAVRENDALACVRQHPFFRDLLQRVERNMARHRKDIRASGRYNVDIVNDCIRPLLQLTDYPFTPETLSQLAHSISPATLKSSLADPNACRRLRLYRSPDTDLVLDWSVEDFLRRRYESIHLSWEPMNVVYRRFGWSPRVISDRDCLIYFAEFGDFVELAELEFDADGRPRALPIRSGETLAAQGKFIPVNRLLIRRKPGPDVEPSLTESIRLMGTPVLHTPPRGKKTTRMSPHSHPSTSTPNASVTNMFAAVHDTAVAMEGDATTRLRHAMHTVPSLRQAAHPAGRTVREFALGNSARQVTPTVEDGAGIAHNDTATLPSSSPQRSLASADTTRAMVYSREAYEALSDAYHRAKVEASMLRRRLLNTDSVDEVAELQDRLSASRAELTRLFSQLARMRALRRNALMHKKNGSSGDGSNSRHDGEEHRNTATLATRPIAAGAAGQDGDDADDTTVALEGEEADRGPAYLAPRGQPEYPEAPEHDDIAVSKPTAGTTTHVAAEEADDDERVDAVQYTSRNAAQDDDDAEITRAIEEYKQEEAALLAGKKGMQQIVPAESTRRSSSPSVTAAASSVLPPATAVQPPAAEDGEEIRNDDDIEHTTADEKDDEGGDNDDDDDDDDGEGDKCADADAAPAVSAPPLSSSADPAATAEIHGAMTSGHAELSRNREELAAMATQLRQELRDLCTRKAREEEQWRQVMREATAKVTEVEQRLAKVIEAQTVAAQRAREFETERCTEQERQTEAEQAARALEQELERKLREVRSQLRGCDDTRAAVVASDAITSLATTPVTASVATTSTTTTDAPPTSSVANYFTCSPEQYDGLHLAADRLRKEVTALEQQMEQEGDEDDETLMAVLAASRADLEELDECIASVQRHTSWAAERDAKRAQEAQQKTNMTESKAQQLQEQIDHQRFNIGLLEKRLQHTTLRAVQSKLEQRIVQARREISRLRIEQDRLRRHSGRDALGVPTSISMAETLAEEVKDNERQKVSDEVRRAASTDGAELTSSGVQSADDDDDVEMTGETETAKSIASAETLVTEARSDEVPRAREEDGTADAHTRSGIDDPEARALQSRLNTMLHDIQNLQDSITAQERTADYDDEETEMVLLDMKDKLSQLLRLRDDVQRRMTAQGAGAEEDASTPNQVAPAVPIATLRGRGASSAAVATPLPETVATTAPTPMHGRHESVAPASKKIRTMARMATKRR